jgi:hypothetical protein
MTAWNDHSGRPRQLSCVREPALPGVFFVSALLTVAPASLKFDDPDTSSRGRFGGGSLSCDSDPPPVKSIAMGWRDDGCEDSTGISDWRDTDA